MKDYADAKTKLRDIISHGLVAGLGEPKPGALCVEAAVAMAMGEPHSDKPSCVAAEDNAFAIHLNDARWSSNAVRAEALLPLALAQLGTAGTDRSAWVKRVVEGTIRRVLPMALRAAAKANPAHAQALEAAAVRCEAEGTREAALHARAAANAAYAAAAYAAADANAAYAAAAAADYAAAACYAADAAYAAAAAANAARAAAAAARAAAAAARAAAARDEVLRVSVAVALDAYAAEGRTP